MNRRNLLGLIGTGLGAGAIGVSGTGAFTSVDADRTATVQVADDAAGYVGLSPSSGPNDQFAKQQGGELLLEFDDSGNGGLGVGQSSNYQFNDVFTVENQGTQDVFVSLAPITGIPIDSGADGEDIDVRFFVPGSSGPRPIENGNGPGPIGGGSGTPKNVLKVPTGESRGVGLFMTTFSYSSVSSGSSGTNSGSATTTLDADEQPGGANVLTQSGGGGGGPVFV
jgi:hypothetical protein